MARRFIWGMALLKEWESFYVIVGSSAGALIGLQFVVMTLIAERAEAPTRRLANALATPTIVHFGAVLLLSALLSAPWKGVPTAPWASVGILGVLYSLLVARRVKTQKEYEPELEDWLFYVLLPLAGYAGLAASAFAAKAHEHEALFGAAGAALLLLFTGIHNSWDSVVYHVTTKDQPAGKSEQSPS
jgi:hypothetical protein